MFNNSRVVFAVLALVSATALIPSTARAFRVGNSLAPNAGRNTPLTSSNRPSAIVRNLRPFCHTVQVGNPRANPPMLVCP
jgi:hypothetical protein